MPKRQKVAVISTDPLPMPLPQGELDVAPALSRAGAEADVVSWHDPVSALDAYDHVVIRTPWDYFDYPTKFQSFVDALDDVDAKVHNPPSVMRWNTHKRYLVELAPHAPVIETHLVKAGETFDLSAAMEARGWSDGAIQKPAIGGGAKNTFVRQRGCAPLVATEDTLVQPFWPQIGEAGELSLIFLGGAYSHTVQKIPQAGDFRVQSEHGGRVVPLSSPPGDAAEAAATVLRAAEEICGGAASGENAAQALTYARVDGIITDDGFRLMELEVIEPELFLEWSEGAADRFARAILDAS